MSISHNHMVMYLCLMCQWAVVIFFFSFLRCLVVLCTVHVLTEWRVEWRWHFSSQKQKKLPLWLLIFVIVIDLVTVIDSLYIIIWKHIWPNWLSKTACHVSDICHIAWTGRTVFRQNIGTGCAFTGLATYYTCAVLYY